MNWKRSIAGALCGLLFAAATPAFAQSTTLASNSFTGGSTASRFVGQSFLVTGSGAYNSITIGFFDSTGNPIAAGNLYVFNAQCYACTPNNVATMGGTAGAANGTQFTFDPGFTLTAGNTYYAYADTRFTATVGISSYADGDAYTSAGTSGNSIYGNPQSGSDTAFSVQGVAVTPEPAGWALMIGGFGMAGTALRRRPRGTLRNA